MTASSKPTVVVLGGGIGGQVAATRLKQQLGLGARVVLVERSPTFTFAPSLLWLMVGKRNARTISRDLSRIERRGVEVTYATVTRIDSERSEVIADTGVIGFDYLVIALGAAHDPGLLPGTSEHAHHPYDLPAAERLRDALDRFSGGRVAVAIASLPYRCPAAPYETAMLIDGYLRERGLRQRSQIDLYTPERRCPCPSPAPTPGTASQQSSRHARSASILVRRRSRSSRARSRWTASASYAISLW